MATSLLGSISQQSDTEFNKQYFSDVYDTQSSVISDVTGGAIATAVDVGTSLWNSLPILPEVETRDILSRISDNALKIYEENPDTIHTASFIGGMFVPLGLAVKGMKLARAGAKGVDWFSDAGRTKSLAQIDELFKTAGPASTEYKTALRSLFGKTAVNQAIDTVAMEAALLLGYNDHPFMEDYLKDPVKNFGISLLLGTGIGAGLGHVVDRAAIRGITGPAYGEIVKTIRGASDDPTQAKTLYPGMTSVDALSALSYNIARFDTVIETQKAAGKTVTDDYLMAEATKIASAARAQRSSLFEALYPIKESGLSEEAWNSLMLRVTDTGTEFFGVDKLARVPAADIPILVPLTGAPTVTSEPSLFKTVKAYAKDALGNFLLDAKGKNLRIEEKRAVRSVYYPHLGVWGTEDSLGSLSSAAALGTNIASLKRAAKNPIYPDYDASLGILSDSTAHIHAQYIGTFAKIDAMSVKELDKLHIAPDDLVALNAAFHRVQKGILAGELPADYKIKFGKGNMTKHTAVLAQKDAYLASRGVEESYAKSMQSLVNSSDFLGTMVSNKGQSAAHIPSDVARTLNNWIGGDKFPLNLGAMMYLSQQGGFIKRGAAQFQTILEAIKTAKGNAVGDYTKTFAAIYNLPESQKLRDYFQRLADPEGMVLLYRGSRKDADRTGTNMLDSFTADVHKAREFGNVNLYKVRVQDIVTHIRDIGSKSTDSEILVLASTRTSEGEVIKGAFVPKKGAAHTGQLAAMPAPMFNEFGITQVKAMMLSAKQNVLESMIASGVGEARMAIAADLPLETVQAFLTTKESLSSLVKKGFSWKTVSSVEKAEEMLDAKNAPIYAAGAPHKNQLARGAANLDNAAYKNINELFISTVLANSTSGGVQALFKDLVELNPAIRILESVIQNANNNNAGMRMFTSYDQFTRAMGDIGPVTSMLARAFLQTRNNLSRAIVSPMSDGFQAFAADIPAKIEFAAAMNIHHSLAGYRVYKDRQWWQKKIVTDTDGSFKEIEEAVEFEGKPFIVVDDRVDKVLQAMQENAPELRELANVNRKIKGLPDIADIGFWAPSFNPIGKSIAYVHNYVTDTTQLIVANSESVLEQKVKAFQNTLIENGTESQWKILRNKTEQEQWNIMNSRMDPITMERADISKQKKGSSSQAIIPATNEIFTEIAGGYEHYITHQLRGITDMYLSDVMDGLQKLSYLNTESIKNLTLTEIQKATRAPKDAAKSIRNTILGLPNDSEYVGWQMANKTFEIALSMGSSTMKNVWESTFGRFKTKTGYDLHKATVEDYAKYAAETEKRGMVNVYQHFQDAAADSFGLAKMEDHKDTSKRIVFGSNALAATVALRFGELAQPLVNMMSLPILTTLAIADRMPETFLGVARKTAQVNPVAVMYDGVRLMNSPAYDDLAKKWESAGFHTALVSEVNDLQRATMKLEAGAVAKLENALDSALVRVLSIPADLSEGLTRRYAMSTGYVLAKHMYPELDDTGATIFARHFMDRAIGNYSAAQRPVMFQGTLGVAMGLFQTYMLTMAQSIYRGLELKNYKALGQAMLAQSTIFGFGSMPGFDPVSKMIGEHFSDDNVDLTTGVFRALPDQQANLLLYGLPSSLGPGFTTRGDLSIRPPAFLGNPENIPAVSMYKQTLQSMMSMVDALKADAPDMARSFSQALSMQSMSRPLARGAEIATGYSVTRQGNTVQVPDEVWTATGIISRVLGTRPIEEVKLRDAIHLNSHYGSIDREGRQALTNKLRTAIRAGNLSDADIATFSEEYLRKGGTPTGWRSAYQDAIKMTEAPGREGLMEKLRPNNPINFMINNLD